MRGQVGEVEVALGALALFARLPVLALKLGRLGADGRGQRRQLGVSMFHRNRQSRRRRQRHQQRR